MNWESLSHPPNIEHPLNCDFIPYIHHGLWGCLISIGLSNSNYLSIIHEIPWNPHEISWNLMLQHGEISMNPSWSMNIHPQVQYHSHDEVAMPPCLQTLPLRSLSLQGARVCQLQWIEWLGDSHGLMRNDSMIDRFRFDLDLDLIWLGFTKKDNYSSPIDFDGQIDGMGPRPPYRRLVAEMSLWLSGGFDLETWGIQQQQWTHIDWIWVVAASFF